MKSVNSYVKAIKGIKSGETGKVIKAYSGDSPFYDVEFTYIVDGKEIEEIIGLDEQELE